MSQDIKTKLACSECLLDISNLEELKKHFKNYHKFTINSQRQIVCCKVGCEKNFLNLKNLYKHMQTYHPDKDEKFLQEPKKLDSLTSLSRMVANLKTSSSILTDTAIDEFISESHKHTENILNDSKAVINDFIANHGSITVENVSELTKRLQLTDTQKYSKSNGHLKAVKENFTYIESISIPLKKRTEMRHDMKSQKSQLKGIYETFEYIPILKTIECVLNNDKMREYVDNESESEEGFLKGFQDGNIYKNHNFFKKYPNALRLQIYFDEILVNNPLGTKTFAHKIGTFYFSILNLPKYVNSYLGGIFLFAICYNADIDKYSMNRILRPFMSDLAKLEDGAGYAITLKNGTDYIIRGTIANVAADGLAAHQMFNMLSPSANYFCRICMITREQLHSVPHFIGRLRTKEELSVQIQLLLEKKRAEKFWH